MPAAQFDEARRPRWIATLAAVISLSMLLGVSIALIAAALGIPYRYAFVPAGLIAFVLSVMIYGRDES